MKPDEHIRRWHDEFTAIRRDLHAHPELGFEEHRTARVVQDTLTRLGIEHHSGIGKTGIVAVIHGLHNTSGRSIGLRADMDALPLVEENEFAHKSRYEGRMHGCGHDGHTTMLLAAARYLQETRNFDGTAYLIFQPGEEGYAGAKAMIEDGLFERFPAEQVFALHNWPGLPACIAHRLTTAVSIGLTLRETIDCTAVMMWPATSTGSIAACGCAPWPPLPVISMVTRSAEAIIAWCRMPKQPGFRPGQLCMAYTASTSKRWNRPSSIIALAPAKPSSPGWKIRTAVPSKLRVSAR